MIFFAGFAVIAFAISVVSVKSLLGYKFTNIGTAIDTGKPAEFDLKLSHLKTLSGKKIVLIGDSFILGESLIPVTGPDWRKHTLDKKLDACLKTDNKAHNNTSEYHVVNFGLNGLLPADIEHMLPAFETAGADLVMFNINNRSFSYDFNAKETRNSRKWISSYTANTANLWQQNSGRFALLKRYSFLETPKDWGLRQARSFLALFGPIDIKSDRLSKGVLLLKLKSRYSGASYDPQISIQAKALISILQSPKVAAFLTIEDASQFNSVADPTMQDQLTKERSALINNINGNAQILPNPDDLMPEDYIDLVHVTPSGYDKYSKVLCQSIIQMWSK